jgi:predicted metallo-beta-lactamase superfamily hydrolase
MSENQMTTIQVTCPCCDATLTIDPGLAVVLDHKLPVRPQMAVELKDAVKMVHDEAARRDEKYQKLAEAEKNKSKVLEAKFQELFKKAKEEPITKPLKDIDLD